MRGVSSSESSSWLSSGWSISGSVLPDQFFRPLAEQFPGAGVDGREPAVEIEHQDGDGGSFQEFVEEKLLFLLPRPFLRQQVDHLVVHVDEIVHFPVAGGHEPHGKVLVADRLDALGHDVVRLGKALQQPHAEKSRKDDQGLGREKEDFPVFQQLVRQQHDHPVQEEDVDRIADPETYFHTQQSESFTLHRSAHPFES
jgi:hypothetical protein